MSAPILLRLDGVVYTIRLAGGRCTVEAPGRPTREGPVAVDGAVLRTAEGQVAFAAVRDGGAVWATAGGFTGRFEAVDLDAPASGASTDEVRAPMTGKVVAVSVAAGQAVAEGQVLAVLTAMKMEYRLGAPRAGVVAAVRCAAGALVDMGQVLVTLAPLANGGARP